MQALKPHGVLVITGIHAAPVAIDLTAMLRKHQQIRGSYRAPEDAWPEVIAFMGRHAAMLRTQRQRDLVRRLAFVLDLGCEGGGEGGCEGGYTGREGVRAGGA